jgi:hypothetical protein
LKLQIFKLGGVFVRSGFQDFFSGASATKDARRLARRCQSGWRSTDRTRQQLKTRTGSSFLYGKFKLILKDLIKPEFIRQDEEFQELLQYFIITDNYF